MGGKNEKLTDCNDVPEDKKKSNVTSERLKYQPDVLAKCVCTGGTKCKATLADGGVASVASTIFVRVALGTLLERFGPVNVQCGLLLWGSIWVALASTISDPWNYILIRFFIGTAGATFVTNQFWSSLMFAPNVVGTANATAAGWGNLGGGVTQIFMIAVLFKPFVFAGMSNGTAWRVAMIVPAIAFVLCAICMKLLCWDTPTKRRFDVADTGKTSGASLWDYVEAWQGHPGRCDDLSVLGLLWHRIGYEQPVGHAFPNLFPDEGHQCRVVGVFFRRHEPLCTFPWRNY